MNMHPPFTDIRSYMSYQFSALRMHALRASLWGRITGKPMRLAVFPEEAPDKSSNRTLLGIQEIPLAEIVGTVARESDFDHRFRPLKKYLRERWVNAYITLQKEGWSPIILHKVGEQYYVEDGHHRVSVARALGMAFIQATIWQYRCEAKEPKICPCEPCRQQRATPIYAPVTE